jgi:four helix bundle protein
MSKLFDHEHLRVYQGAIEFLAWLEGVVPSIKRSVSARDHLARASSGVPVNIAEASGKLSVNERRQFIDTAYGSSLECAACLDVLNVLGYLAETRVQEGKVRLSAVVAMLIGFRQSTGREVREECVPYETGNTSGNLVWFDHERLDVLATRHAELKQKTMEGKVLLADAVRMLVAWQRSLTKE